MSFLVADRPTTGERCQAETAGGKRCQRSAGPSGYCYQHVPSTRSDAESKLTQVLGVLELTCEAKGWDCWIKNTDTATWRYASVHVERRVGIQHAEGLVDVTVDDGVKLTVNKISFHEHGLNDLRSAMIDELCRLPWLESPKQRQEPTSHNVVDRLKTITTRFHRVARALVERHDQRETLLIEDEYDVQDLLRGLLQLDFDDVRSEEHCPSYAGSNSRTDFLLKREGTVLEVKYATPRLRDRQIGEQLIVDIERYQKHPDCQRLVCFVYDPLQCIGNPVALEDDLSGKRDGVDVRVLVRPR